MVDEPEGFRDFVLSRSSDLLTTAWFLTGDAQRAQDLLQSALARTWPHWSRVRNDQPEAYVWRVMVNLQASWWRRRWSREVPVAEPQDLAAVEASSQVDERAILAAALRAVPVRQRQVWTLRHYHDLSPAQVAVIMGCSEGTGIA